MHKLFYPFLLTTALLSPAFGQFPMTGGSPGGGPGNRPAATIPGTANDATPRGNGKISGVLLDEASGKPVEYATVALISKATGKPIDGTTSDERGQFSLTRVAPGAYKIQATFLGYQNKEVDNLTIAKGTELNVGVLKLAADVRTLQEVEVTGQKAMIEEKVDRLVYNAERDVTTKGGDATDVMRRVPMLSVDLDGNVSLRGSQNVRVLINNKPSTIVASSVADALKQIPADMIKSVEVITSPSAKYDAEGSAGIINIITKKNTLQGLTLNLDSGVGNRGSMLGLNGNYRTGKMGFSLGGFGRAGYNIKGKFNNTQISTINGQQFSTVQTSESLNRNLFGHYQLGWDYDINKNNSLTASVRFGLRNQNSTQDLTTIRQTATTVQSTLRDVATKDNSQTVDINLDYTRTFSKPQQELSVLTQFSRNNRTNNFTSVLLDPFLSRYGEEGNDNNSYNQESTIQVDYQTPVKRNQMLEFGGKGIFRQVYSNIQYNSTITTPAPDNVLDYDQNVAASYLSYTYTTKSKYTFKVGGRYEYTMIDARFRQEQPITDDQIPDYGSFVPSVNVSKNLKGGKTIRAAYNRRLQRPGIQFLNPNINFSNPDNISYGNPYLRPEMSNNYEVSLSVPIKAVYLNMTAFARNTDGSIESVVTSRLVNDTRGERTVFETTYQNIGKQEAYGMNFFGNVTLFSKWQIGGGFDAYYTYLTNNNPNPALFAENDGVVIQGRMFTNLTLKKGWGIQGFGGMRGNQVNLQGTQGSFYMYSLGFRKDFPNKRGSLGLAAENFLTNSMKVRTTREFAGSSQNSLNQMYNRGVRMTFNYRIGKMSFDQQPRRRKKSVSNDDVKGGGGDGGNDAGGGQQAAPQQQGQGGGRPRQ
ncbi:TonB-dependent receptor domain-containing protein [Tellurirhabdus rosea]|uniref:TonB-dependent receptor domain-containing protein n=1 Tax=Tellurirhabdus rosea TaxID=2674997 RepID=UPI0022567E04|nr:TonB-dependent receptor [Tellurirhabdus rosea]